MSTLLVRLPHEPPPVGEYGHGLSHDGQTLASQGLSPLDQLPRLAGAGHETVAVIPARALSWHQVELPARLPAAQQKQALHGLLEDALLDEPTRLHCALGPEQDGARWVAVCDRDWLRAHLHALDEAGHVITRIVPEHEPLPEGPAQAHITNAAGGIAQLVRADARGVTVLPLSSVAWQWLAWPKDAPLHAEPAVATQAEALCHRPVTLVSPAQRWLEASRSDWNLAQHEFTHRGSTRWLRALGRSWQSLRYAPQWKAARWLLLALLLTQWLSLQALAWRERYLLSAQQQRQRDILLQTFPGIPLVVDAPLQMERQLAQLQQSAGAASPRDLESMLATLLQTGDTLPTPQTIDYRNNQLRLGGLTLAAPDVAALSARLQARGYALRQDGADWTIRMQEEAKP